MRKICNDNIRALFCHQLKEIPTDHLSCGTRKQKKTHFLIDVRSISIPPLPPNPPSQVTTIVAT